MVRASFEGGCGELTGAWGVCSDLLRMVLLKPAGVSLEQQNVEFVHVQQGRARSHPYTHRKVSAFCGLFACYSLGWNPENWPLKRKNTLLFSPRKHKCSRHVALSSHLAKQR